MIWPAATARRDDTVSAALATHSGSAASNRGRATASSHPRNCVGRGRVRAQSVADAKLRRRTGLPVRLTKFVSHRPEMTNLCQVLGVHHLVALTGADGPSRCSPTVRDSRADFVVTADNAAAVSQICHRRDGMRLAIEFRGGRGAGAITAHDPGQPARPVSGRSREVRDGGPATADIARLRGLVACHCH